MDGTSEAEVEKKRGPQDHEQADLDLWQRLAAPASDVDYFEAWLVILCSEIRNARVGVLLLRDESSTYVPTAVWPDLAADFTHLSSLAEQALINQRVSIQALRGPHDQMHMGIALPLLRGGEAVAVTVIEIAGGPQPPLQSILRQIQLASGWVSARLAVDRSNGESFERPLLASAAALKTVTALSGSQRFETCLTAFCNEIATALDCDRVSLALTSRRGLVLSAMSHAVVFHKRSAIVRGLETVMEEAAAQNRSVRWPEAEEKTVIAVAHRNLSKTWTIATLASIPLRAEGELIGVITIERSLGPLLTSSDLLAAELMALASAPLLRLQRDRGRLVDGRIRRGMTSAIKSLIGRNNLVFKISTLAVCVAVIALAMHQTEFRVTARAVLEGEVQRAAVAPFQGFIAEAPVRAGQTVRAGQLLARLEDHELGFEKLKLDNELTKQRQRQREAVAKADRSGALSLLAEIEQVRAQTDIIADKLRRTKIVAPIDGLVVTGDLSQMIGAPVEQGKMLFEIAPLSSYRVVLQVQEEDLRFVRPGQRGLLVLTGETGVHISFRVTSIVPVSSPVNGHNTFRTEATLEGASEALRPGMEGVGKIEIRRVSALWALFRPLMDKVRMFAWTWAP